MKKPGSRGRRGPAYALTLAAAATIILFAASGVITHAPAGVPQSDAGGQFADANTLKKIHFTQTLTSSMDPGIAQDSVERHIAIVLSPNEGTIYDGSMTYASSSPVGVLVLHSMTSGDIAATADTGLPVWTVDGKTTYAASVLGPASDAGALDFTGAAVALYGAEEFAATVSVDGWVRGNPTPVVMQTIEVDAQPEEPRLHLSRASVPATIPMREGLYDGKPLLYVITDSSDKRHASKISDVQGWQVSHAPGLQSGSIPEEALQRVYVFRNGADNGGGGLYGYQPEVFSSTPDDEAHSALSEVIEVSWRPGQNKIILESAEDVEKAEEAGRIIFSRPGHPTGTGSNLDGDSAVMVVANMHQIAWGGDKINDDDGDSAGMIDHGHDAGPADIDYAGRVDVRTDGAFSGDGMISYGGGQVTDIDTENMTVTFVAHRSWGPDGRTTYHIVTGATPERPAGILGAKFMPAYAGLVDHSAAADLYIFENGIAGSGSLGYQPAIFAAAPENIASDENNDDGVVARGHDDDNYDNNNNNNGSASSQYTPIWRVHTVEWNDPASDAGVLENLSDIESFRDAEKLTAGIARPTNSYYVINAPLIDPFQ